VFRSVFFVLRVSFLRFAWQATKPAALSAKKFARGTFHTKTIFLEKNPDLIAKIQEMMKYDYAGEPDETESFEEGIPEVSESTE